MKKNFIMKSFFITKKNLAGILLCTALAASALAGCGDREKDNTQNDTSSDDTDNTQSDTSSDDTDNDAQDSAADDESSKIGISMPSQALERWNRDGAYLEEQFKKAGFETILTYSDDDAKKQAEDIQNMLSADVDLLVIAAIDDSTLDPVLDAASLADVPVIAYDRLIENEAVSYYVSFDNYAVGRMQGEFITEYLDLENASDEVYNMEITAGDPADHNAAQYYQGAIDVLQPYMDRGTLNIVSGQTDFDNVATPAWSTEHAQSRAQNLLSSYYADGTQLDVWLCSNDSTALGITQALAAGYAGSNPILITGQDGDEANLKNIADDIQTMTVFKNLSDEAVVTFRVAEAILTGGAADESLISSLGIKCTYEDSEENTCPSFLLEPVIITKDNLQDLADTGLYTMGNDGYLSSAAKR